MYTGNIHTCSSRSQAIIYWLLVDNNHRGEGAKACVCVAPFGVQGVFDGARVQGSGLVVVWETATPNHLPAPSS